MVRQKRVRASSSPSVKRTTSNCEKGGLRVAFFYGLRDFGAGCRGLLITVRLKTNNMILINIARSKMLSTAPTPLAENSPLLLRTTRTSESLLLNHLENMFRVTDFNFSRS